MSERRIVSSSPAPRAGMEPTAAASARTTLSLAKENMHGSFAREVLRTLIAQCACVDALQKILAGPKQYGPDREVEFIDDSGLQVLPDGGYAAAQPDIATAGRCLCLS